MKITPGWYRTNGGHRALVSALAPHDTPLMWETHYAIGWVVIPEGDWCAMSWSGTGRADEDETGPDDLLSPEPTP